MRLFQNKFIQIIFYIFLSLMLMGMNLNNINIPKKLNLSQNYDEKYKEISLKNQQLIISRELSEDQKLEYLLSNLENAIQTLPTSLVIKLIQEVEIDILKEPTDVHIAFNQYLFLLNHLRSIHLIDQNLI